MGYESPNDRAKRHYLEAIATGNERYIALAEANYAAVVTGGKMASPLDQKFNEAQARLDKGVGSALRALAALEAERDRVPSAYFDAERLRIVREARSADRGAMDAVTEYQRAALAEARNLRAAAEASVDPATRLADLTERKSLAESPLDGDALMERAAEMLEAGQPKRAALLLAAAEDKGGSKFGLFELKADVEAALDDAVPERAKAREIETAAADNVAQFRATRLRQLYDSRLGVRQTSADEPTEIGSGDRSEVAAASLAAKVEAWAAAQDTGEPYVDPVPETSLPNLSYPAK